MIGKVFKLYQLGIINRDDTPIWERHLVPFFNEKKRLSIFII